MQDTALLIGGAAIVALSAIAGLVGWIVSLRSIREHRAATEQALRAKEEAAEVLSQEVARLDDHIGALHELDSIRFAQRYIEAKSGLEGRVTELSGKLSAAHNRKETLRRELDRMLPDDSSRAVEAGRMRAELIRAQQEAHRLEQILESLSEVGPIPADHVRAELTRRRETQIELRGQLDRLSLAGVAREAALDLLRTELESARAEERELERDLEIAHSAAPVLDGLLGITADVTDRLQDLQARLGDPLRVLADSRQGNRFLRAIGAPRADGGSRLIESSSSHPVEESTLAPASTERSSPVAATAAGISAPLVSAADDLAAASSGNGARV